MKPKKKRLVARMKKLAEEAAQATQPAETTAAEKPKKTTKAKPTDKKKGWFKKSSK